MGNGKGKSYACPRCAMMDADPNGAKALTFDEALKKLGR